MAGSGSRSRTKAPASRPSCTNASSSRSSRRSREGPGSGSRSPGRSSRRITGRSASRATAGPPRRSPSSCPRSDSPPRWPRMPDQILVVEDDENLAFVLCEAMGRKGYRAEAVATMAAVRERLKAAPYDLVLLDLKLPDGDGLEAIPECRELAPDTPIIAMTAYAVRHAATEALRRGAYDFFTKPLKIAELEIVVGRALERRRLQQHIARLEASRATGFEELVGSNQALVRALEAAQRVAPTDLTVLIEGESGTGKELLAQAIHRRSARKDGPLVAVNCAAIPEGLLESELFGHERGAFTGAIRTRVGRLELASGGTLFLDEIGDMPPAMQAKILRALEERKIERGGGGRPIDVDVRNIPAAIQTPGVQQCATPSGRSLDEAIDDLERQLILAALGRAGGVQVRAARLLGITEQSLWYRIKKHGIQARVGGSPPAWPPDIAALPPARPAPPVALASSAARDLDRLAKRSRFSAQKSNAG